MTLRALALVAAMGCYAREPRAPTAPQVRVFVIAPGGADTAPGTLAAPLATLERARDMIRDLRRVGELPAGGVVVELRGGVYERSTAFVLGPEDSGTQAAPVVYRAHAGERVRFVGGRMVPTSAFQVADDSRLPVIARGHVLVADLHALGVTDFGGADGDRMGLIARGRPVTLARWPNRGFVEITAATSDGHISIASDRPAHWRDEPEAWVHGYWYWDWADSRHRIATIDENGHALALSPPAHQYGYRAGQWFYAYNLISELDSPGEWYLDHTRGLLFWWPAEVADRADVAVSVARTLVDVKRTSWVRFEGLSFEAARGTAIHITDSDNVSLRACTIRAVNGWGVEIRGGRTDRIENCEIADTGLGGLVLEGGDRPSLEPSAHEAVDNRVHDYARWHHAQEPGIVLRGVGNRAANNKVYNAPNQAIAFDGNDHVIEGNEIHDVCMETNDCGAIYAMRDWTMRGTAIRNNFLHDLRGFRDRGCNAVYLDDLLSGIEVSGNLFMNVARAVLIGGGRDNSVTSNVFILCDKTVTIDSRGTDWGAASIETEMMPRLRAVPYTSPRWRARYPRLATILADAPAEPRGNIVADNLDWLCAREAER